MPAPRFELPEPVRRLLRSAPRAQGSWGRWAAAARDVARRHRVLPLVVDAEGLLALAADGQVVMVRWTRGAEPTAVADVRTRDLAVLHALPRHPELRALLPSRQAGDVECHCRGVADFEPSMPSVVCVCGGLGFFPARWHDAEAEARAAEEPPPSPRPAPPSRRNKTPASPAMRSAPSTSAALALEPAHIAGSSAEEAIAAAQAIASSRRPTVRRMTPVPISAADAGLRWRPRQRRVRRLALAMFLALVCGALAMGWSAWAASSTSTAASCAPGPP